MPKKHKREDEIFEDLKPFFYMALVQLRGEKSQESLAKKSGFDAGTLRRLEKGDAPLRRNYISGVCRGLDITLADFLRSVADCCEAAEENGTSYRQMSPEKILRRLRKLHDARARLEKEASEIDLEIKRRQIPDVDPLDRGELP